MRGIDLLKDIGAIDERLVQEAALDIDVKKGKVVSFSKWTRWGSLAAGFVVLFVAAVALQQSFRSDNMTETASMLDMNQTRSYTASGKDAAAEAYIVEEALDAAMPEMAFEKNATATLEEAKEAEMKKCEDTCVTEECYAIPDKGTYYLMPEIKETIATQEGQQILYYVVVDVFGDVVLETGEVVYEQTSQINAEYERLLGMGYEVIIEEEELRGYFAKEELENFSVNPEYGYVFRLAEEVE